MKELTEVKKSLELDERGLPKISTLQEQSTFATGLLASGMLPKSYKSASEVVAAMQMAAEAGLKPGMMTLRRTANINGTPSFFGELPLAIVMASGNLAEASMYYYDKEGVKIHPSNRNMTARVHGFFIEGIRKDNNVYHYEFYDLDKALAAGLGNVWKKHPEDMLKWRTVGKWCKTLFSDVLGGSSIAEYDHNILVDEKAEVVTSNVDNGGLSDLNSRFEENPEPRSQLAIELVGIDAREDYIEVTPEDSIIEEETGKETVKDDGYVIPLGTHKGKTVGQLSEAELFITAEKLTRHLAGMPGGDQVCQVYLERVNAQIGKLGIG